MSIKTLLDSLNPSRKVLMWIATTVIAAVPAIWLIATRIATDNVMDNTRFNNLETSVGNLETSVGNIETDIKGLFNKFDEAEDRFVDTYKNGVDEVGEIIKKSDKQQTEQIKFLVDNWSEQNRQLIIDALELRQDENEKNIDMMLDKTKKDADRVFDPIIVPLDEEVPRIYNIEDATLIQLDSIDKKYKIIAISLNQKGNYNIRYRDYTFYEKEEIDYFNRSNR